MTEHMNPSMMYVPMHERTVERLFSLRDHPDEPLSDVAERHIGIPPRPAIREPERVKVASVSRPAGVVHAKRNAEILGERIGASTLGRLLVAVVDFMDDLDPSVMERLSRSMTRKRRYIARAAADVHPWSPHLKTLKSESGWWVSANVSSDQVKGFLKAICAVASLTFGTDVRFPAS